MGNSDVITALIQEGCALDRQDKVKHTHIHTHTHSSWVCSADWWGKKTLLNRSYKKAVRYVPALIHNHNRRRVHTCTLHNKQHDFFFNDRSIISKFGDIDLYWCLKKKTPPHHYTESLQRFPSVWTDRTGTRRCTRSRGTASVSPPNCWLKPGPTSTLKTRYFYLHPNLLKHSGHD